MRGGKVAVATVAVDHAAAVGLAGAAGALKAAQLPPELSCAAVPLPGLVATNEKGCETAV